jgi:hypothetical protein
MLPIDFTSTLSCDYRDELEQLLFMNGNQKKVHESALLAIERYGTPQISTNNNRLWVTFDSGIEAQSLFLVERCEERDRLVGAIVYTRDGNTLDVLFIAVLEAYSFGGEEANASIFFSSLATIKSIARRIKGIESIRLFIKKPPLVISIKS